MLFFRIFYTSYYRETSTKKEDIIMFKIIEKVVNMVKRRIDPYYDWDMDDQTYDPDEYDE